ncbi:hypothetical protein NC652_011772 [Populus alba x Populus x berolinensis]|nr:hypothetical protein NC652_011772 [Populus alba x Populus x berolinensis]
MSVDILGLLPPFGTEAPDNSTIQFMSEQRTVLEYWDSRPFKIEMNNFASSVEWGGEAYGPAKWHQWELMLQFPATHTGTQIMKKVHLQPRLKKSTTSRYHQRSTDEQP